MIVWLRRAGVALVLGGVALAVGVGALVGPYVRDDIMLDRIVRAVVLDWRDFGLETAQTRLQYELDKQYIGFQVADEDCAFTELDDGGRRVHCAWSVDVRVPGSERGLPLSFESTATLARDGDLF